MSDGFRGVGIKVEAETAGALVRWKTISLGWNDRIIDGEVWINSQYVLKIEIKAPANGFNKCRVIRIKY